MKKIMVYHIEVFVYIHLSRICNVLNTVIIEITY